MKGAVKTFLIGVVALGMMSSIRPFAQAETPNVIKLGCAIAFTGKESRTGKYYRDSYDMAVAKVNESGGVKVGNKTYQLEIVYYDDKSDPTESSRLVEKLITQDKVNFLLGPYSSGITIPDSIIAQRYQVPMIQGGGASGKIFDHGNKYIFGTLPPAGQYFKSTLEMLKTFKPAPKTVAILYSGPGPWPRRWVSTSHCTRSTPRGHPTSLPC
jgi:branched-chain amino acid transport system substrate-binding protein